MVKDVLAAHSFEASKNFISTNYQSLKHGTGYSTCVFALMNVLYLLTGLLSVAAGVTGEFAYLAYGLRFEFYFISMFWLVNGVVLLYCSIIGMIAVYKNSVSWTHIYLILTSTAFVVQFSTAIFGYTFISNSKYMARHTLDRFIHSYGFYQSFNFAMDLIQKTLKCCGVDSPQDWSGNWKYNRASYSLIPPTNSTNRTPESCCPFGYDFRNLQCEDHFQIGCLGKVHEIISETMIIYYYIALAIAVFHIIGIVSALVAAKMIRQTKCFRENLYRHVMNTSTFVDYPQMLPSDVNDNTLDQK